MKKLTKILVAILSLLAITCFSFACAPSTPDNGGEVQAPPQHTHVFNVKKINDDYLISKATCESKAVYYYACECGEKGTVTYEYGNKLSHKYGEAVSNGDGTHVKVCVYDSSHKKTENCVGGSATCTQKAVCLYCNAEYGDFASHIYASEYSYDENRHWQEVTCGCNIEPNYEDHGTEGEYCATCGYLTKPTDGIIYDKSADGTYAEVVGYDGSAKKLKIADTYQGLPVKSIYKEAFKDTDITFVIIPDSVASIGSSAFYDCDALTSVVIGDSVTSIGSDAFFGCYSLTSVQYKGSIDSWAEIGFVNAYSFFSSSNPLYYARKLIIDGKEVTEVNLTTATKINDYAFYGADFITSVVIGDSVESIGSCAFDNCDSLTSVVIPDSVKSISSSMFSGCNNLQYNTYDNCKYLGSRDNDYYALISVTNQNLSSYEIHESTKIIANSAFDGCERISSIIIPDSVTSIGSYAFSSCYSLTSVVIGDSVKDIGEDAFSGCSSLMSVVIGDSVTSIGKEALAYCYKLTSVVIPDSVTSIGSSAFERCTSLTSVEYTGSIDSWVEIEFFGSSSNPLYYAKKLIIDGKEVTEVNLTTATKINDYAFYGADFITSVVIGDSVESIGLCAFDNCNSLTSVVIPNSVTSISSSAFYRCTSLTSVVIGDSVKSIGSSAFYDCDSLTSVVIGDSVTSIGSDAFRECTSLTSVEYKGSIDSWVEIEFCYAQSNPIYYAKKLIIDGKEVTEVNLTTATKINDCAFYYCESLTSVVIGDSVTSIGGWAFCYCDSLTIYCEVESKPSGWDSDWNYSNCPVVWGYKG